MASLSGYKVAILATDGVEESELTEPLKALKDAGAEVHVLSPKSGKIQAFRHFDKSIHIDVDRSLDEAKPDDYDALMLPGGALNADQLRVMDQVKSLARQIHESGKPIAAICHAPWLLVSAGLLKGKKLTSWHTLQDDIRNAGAEWLDQECVVDDSAESRLVTSRGPKDLPIFCREMIRVFSEGKAKAKAA